LQAAGVATLLAQITDRRMQTSERPGSADAVSDRAQSQVFVGTSACRHDRAARRARFERACDVQEQRCPVELVERLSLPKRRLSPPARM